MVKILKCNIDILKRLPAFYNLIYDTYGSEKVLVYAVLDADNLKFLIVGRECSLYVDQDGYRYFTIDNECNLRFYKDKEYGVYFNGIDMTFRDDKNVYYNIDFVGLNSPEDGYNGRIIFNQMDVANDTFCQLAYPQMYNIIDGRAPIYSYHSRDPKQVYIEENKSKKKFRYGLVPKGVVNYNRYTFDRDSKYYDFMLIKEYGLIRYLTEGKYNLCRDPKLVKYAKARYIFKDKLIEDWPFVSMLNKESVYELINKYGFKISIPEEMISCYNHYSKDINTIEEVLEELKKIKDNKDYKVELSLKK